MTDESGDDAKVLAVPIDKICKIYRKVQDFRDMSPVALYKIPRKGTYIASRKAVARKTKNKRRYGQGR